jgi:hypothetical protein
MLAAAASCAVSLCHPLLAFRPFDGESRGLDTLCSVPKALKDEMKVVRHDRIADQVDSEERGKLAEVIFDPRFSVVEILP